MFIQKIQNNIDEINKWYEEKIFVEENDFILKDLGKDVLRIKLIRNPDFSREDLLTIDILKDPQIRTVVLFEFFAHTEVGIHNHKDTSYMATTHEMQPVDNIEYKSTHFTFETNPYAYMVYKDQKIKWEKNIFNEYELVKNNHSAINEGNTSVKFLYFDYYDS
jgi:hypothetical protein